MTDITVEQMNTAVAMQKLSSDSEYIKLQLNHLTEQFKNMVTKSELEEVKKDFNATIKRMDDAQAQHNIDDKESFGGLADGQSNLRDVVKFWGGVIACIAFFLPFLVPLFLHYVLHVN